MDNSCILLFMSIDNTEKGPGPKSAHAREHDAEAALATVSDSEKEKETPSSGPLQEPLPTHQEPGADRAVDAVPVAAETR